MSTFPSVISTISNPNPTDKLNSPSHSSIEQAQNDGIKKLETFIGTESSAVGTFFYDIRGAGSNGGGHVQSANKGGTGQTAFTKGDVLIAQSSSVLTKLAVGSDGQALTADSTQAAGVKWSGVATATQIQNQTYVYARASVMSGSVYGVVLGQAVSILSDGLGLVIKFPKANASSVVAITVNATGPSSLTALVKTPFLNNLQVGAIQPSMIGLVEFDSVSSVFQMVGTPATIYKVGGTTKDSSDASATQNIPHGLGSIPKYTKIICTIIGVNYTGRSEAQYDGTTQDSLSNYGNAANGVADNTFSLNSPLNGSAAFQRGVVTFDATNIIITWTKTASPTGIYNLSWLANT